MNSLNIVNIKDKDITYRTDMSSVDANTLEKRASKIMRFRESTGKTLTRAAIVNEIRKRIDRLKQYWEQYGEA